MDTLSPRPALRLNPNGRAAGVAMVIALHALLVYGLWTAMRHDIVKTVFTKVQLVKAPDEEIPKPPLPPIKLQPSARQTQPEPQLAYQPQSAVAVDTPAPQTIATSTDLPLNKNSIDQPARDTGPALAAAPTDIRLACPVMVKPEMPRQAVLNNTTGTVRATAIIRGGVVRDVVNLTGPRIFYAAVKTAMLQYRCEAGAGEVSATQEFSFQMTE